jgi:hypothetical protein
LLRWDLSPWTRTHWETLTYFLKFPPFPRSRASLGARRGWLGGSLNVLEYEFELSYGFFLLLLLRNEIVLHVLMNE